jgi:hypothetical protein
MAKIDTGDKVLITTNNERWLVAKCEDGYVTCCGWPETRIAIEHCQLLKKATPEYRIELLHELAKLKDCRGEYARRVLSTPTHEDLRD